IGNVTTYEHGGKQDIAILSGVGGWAGIGLAAGLTDPTAGLGAGGGYAALRNYTSLGGQLTGFALPRKRTGATPVTAPGLGATAVGGETCASRRRSTGWGVAGVGVSVRHAMSQVKVMPVRHVVVAVMLAAGPFVGGASVASADGSGDPAAVKNEGGK